MRTYLKGRRRFLLSSPGDEGTRKEERRQGGSDKGPLSLGSIRGAEASFISLFLLVLIILLTLNLFVWP